MTTVELFDQSKTGAVPRHYEAAELAGDLGHDEFLAKFTDAELDEVSLTHHVAAEGAMLECCADIIERCRRAGPDPVRRAKALQTYGQLTGKGSWSVYQMFLVGKFYTPERKERFPTVTFEHLSSAIRYTHRDGETRAERQERIERVVTEAADGDLNVSKTRLLAQSVDRDPTPTRGELLDPYDAPAPEPLLEIPTHEAPGLVEAFTAGLEKRLTRENSGLWSEVAVIVRVFLCERVAQGWRLEAPR